MYNYINGSLSYKDKNFVVIEAGGVGYKIFSSLSCICGIGKIGSKVKLFTYLRVGEGIFELYGFEKFDDLNMFKMLIKISGVGAKLALSILSTVEPKDLILSVLSDDCSIIKHASGVGAKLAQRVMLELKDKFKNKSDLATDEGNIQAFGSKHKEAMSALLALGYSNQEGLDALNSIEQNLNLEDTIKLALSKLAKFHHSTD